MSKIDVLAAMDTRAASNLHALSTYGYVWPDDIEQTAAYVTAVAQAMRSNAPLGRWLTMHCTECGTAPGQDDDEHVIIDGYVIIGCEGYWIVNPATVGFDLEGWDDWTEEA